MYMRVHIIRNNDIWCEKLKAGKDIFIIKSVIINSTKIQIQTKPFGKFRKKRRLQQTKSRQLESLNLVNTSINYREQHRKYQGEKCHL